VVLADNLLEWKIGGRLGSALSPEFRNPETMSNVETRPQFVSEGKYRYEVGDLRIVYRINETDKTILIEAIGPRGDIYK
jgi:mRNA-degrading endonuclease RelE of RelBE toxin-antitoxin system